MKKIAVIGHTGIVGNQIYRWFKESNHNVLGISKSKKDVIWKEINKKVNYFFIAVPTPYDWEKENYDLSILKEVINKIGNSKIVIIKSTIPPGTTLKLQKENPQLKLIFNPEFLSRKTAWEDFINPDRQIIGYTKKSYPHTQEVLHLLPISPYDTIIKATEAEICKYINNFHGALMVIFSNFIYDVCDKLNIDYKAVKKASMAAKWVGSPMGRMYWNIFQDGMRGYGGGCFPKDINTLIKWSKENNIEAEILKATRKANKRLLKKEGLTEKEAEKKL